jgi:hypothetical protein
MRKARYDMKQVICPNASLIAYGTRVVRPGYWIEFKVGSNRELGRVLGRVAETDRDGIDCTGHLAVIRLICEGTAGGICWVPPADVIYALEKPPAKFLAWITGDEWVKSQDDIARIVAMNEHGTLSESYIENRDNPDQAYNARPEYIKQFILD